MIKSNGNEEYLLLRMV